MRILITNDDGIHAHGLKVLENIARQLSDDVFVVAPETDQSGVSHSLSLNDPLRLRKISHHHYAVKGTPTDCVIMAMRHVLVDRKPDLILSGINRGQNAAEDVTYSGTIAAAMEGAILGVPSIAFSQAYVSGAHDDIPWQCGMHHGASIIKRILELGIPKNTLINVNFPACAPEDVRGIAVCSQGQRNQEWYKLDERKDGRGNSYFWVAFTREEYARPVGTDLAALADQRIAITPLKLDLTDYPTMTEFAALFDDIKL